MLNPSVGGSGDRQERAAGRGNSKDMADTGGGDSGVTWADRPAEPGVSAPQGTDD